MKATIDIAIMVTENIFQNKNNCGVIRPIKILWSGTEF